MNSNEPTGYSLGESPDARRRLEIQDAQFAQVSEALLDALELQPDDVVVELGIGPGGLGRRIFRRLGPGGLLRGVDYTQRLLDQAAGQMQPSGGARFEPVLADIQQLGSWLEDADVVVGRTVLHHLPMVEVWLGRLRGAVRPGTRVGFVEPEFRILMGRIAALESTRPDEMRPLREWAEGIVRYYNRRELSAGIGATLALALRAAGYSNVEHSWNETPTDADALENMLLYYDEIREQYAALGIMTGEQIDEQKRRIAKLQPVGLPPVWGTHSVTAVA